MKKGAERLVGYVLISMISAFVSVAVYRFLDKPERLSSTEMVKTTLVAEHQLLLSDRLNRALLSATPTDFTEAAMMSRDAVVSVRVSDIAGTNISRQSSGSGVIFTSDGYIATNFHVVKNAEYVQVLLNNQRVYKGKIVGVDESTDLALIKIEAENLPFLIFGNSDSLRIGEWVMAVGNPFMLQSTVTAGIVSAKARNINILESQGIESFIQTDAAVNPGSSGGALINTKGQLVGVNTAILSMTGNYEGYAFAIPSNIARKVLTDLKEYGVVQRAWLGIEIVNLDQMLADKIGINEIKGVYIASVAHKGSAYDGGLRNGDVILSIENTNVATISEFMEQVALYRPGDQVSIMYFRNGTRHATRVQLRNQINTIDFVAVVKDKVLEDVGMEVRDLDENEKKISSSKGVYVVSVSKGGLISSTRLEPGYIIKSINNKSVTSAKELITELKKLRGKSVILEGLYLNYPGEYPYTFVMPIN